MTRCTLSASLLLFLVLAATASIPQSVAAVATAEEAGQSLYAASSAASDAAAGHQSAVQLATAATADAALPTSSDSIVSNLPRTVKAAADGARAAVPRAQCTLLLQGSNSSISGNASSNSSTGLQQASLQCSGGSSSVVAAVSKLLDPFAAAFTGWQESSDADCTAVTSECLITFCSGTRVTFGPGSQISNLRPQDITNLLSVICLRNDTSVEFLGANVSANYGVDKRGLNADRKTNSIFSVNDTSELLLTDCHAEGNDYIRIVDADGSNSSIVISSSNFTENAGTANGAVIRIVEGASLTISNSTFLTNQVLAHNAAGGEQQQQQQLQ